MREAAEGEADVTAPKPSDSLVTQPPAEAQKTPKGKAARRQKWRARRKNKLEDVKFTDDPTYQRQQHQLFTGESGAARGNPEFSDGKSIASWPRKGKKGAKGQSKGKGRSKQKTKKK